MNGTSTELREWAARCENLAATAITERERASLLRKADGLRALADSEDWLAGQPSDGASAKPAELPTCIKSLAAE